MQILLHIFNFADPTVMFIPPLVPSPCDHARLSWQSTIPSFCEESLCHWRKHYSRLPTIIYINYYAKYACDSKRQEK